MFDLLCSGHFQSALEIGWLNGASSTAFIEAINRSSLGRATFCDIDIRPSLQSVLTHCGFPDRVQTYEGLSTDLLRGPDRFDFVFVDGDHRWNTVRTEVDSLLERMPVCVMAHDTNAQAIQSPDCEGPPLLKWRFQTTPSYRCLEDNALRPGEGTHRGMFLATTSCEIFEQARASLEKWGAIGPVIDR